MNNFPIKKTALALIFLSLFGCKSSEEKLTDLCVSKLEKQLSVWAEYDGWSLSNVKAGLYKMEPATDMNERHKTDMFYNFEVILSDFTVKNGFNADVKSVSSCTGYISKNSDGEYDPPSELLTEVTLGDQKLGI